MIKYSQNMQDVFLNFLRDNKVQITIYLSSGVQLKGMIVGYDVFSVLLRRDAYVQLVYKHAISTIVPGTPMQIFQDVGREAEEMRASLNEW